MKSFTRSSGCALLFLFWISLSASRPATQTAPPRDAVPAEPITAIVDAFRSHRIVAVTAGHTEERGYAFGLSLVRDARFIGVVNDIVIEEGSARYQDVADRFVRGDEVADASLSQIWRNTTQPGPGLDRPWEEFFRAVREINASLPRARQLRILLGDPPIDWDAVHSMEDHRKWIEMRDVFPVDLIQREVLAKGRRALITYGQMHFQRKNILANYESEGLAQTVVSRLERTTGTSVFVIWTSTDLGRLQANVATWPVPSIALVDAVLYQGSQPLVIVPISPSRCADAANIEMHLRRMALAGVPPPESERLKQYCAGVGVNP